jgi:HTH-type transcriptional regulator/antitoxin HigA
MEEAVMSVKRRKGESRDLYMDLIRAFPLRPLRSEADRDAAGAIMNKLAIREGRLAAEESDYLDVLSDLIEAYDRRHWPMPPTRSTPVERLRYLMEQTGMSAKGLAERLNCSASLVSLMLSGKRELSKANVVALATHFKVEAGYYL